MVNLLLAAALAVDCTVMLGLGALFFDELRGTGTRREALACAALLVGCLVTAGATVAGAVLLLA